MRFIVAHKTEQAIVCARTDWGWEQTGKFEFVDNYGNKVRVLRSATEILGRPRPTTVYLGLRYSQHHEWGELCRMKDGGCIVTEFPEHCEAAKQSAIERARRYDY